MKKIIGKVTTRIKNGKPQYRVRYQQANGQRREKVFLSEQKAIDWTDAFVAKHEVFGRLTDETIDFRELGRQYLAASKVGRDGGNPLRPSTIKTYDGYFENWVFPFLDGLAIVEIDNETMRELLHHLLSGLRARRSAQQAFNLCKTSLRWARSRGLIKTVPGEDLSISVTALDQKETPIMTSEQMWTIREAAHVECNSCDELLREKAQVFRPMFLLLSLTGMRISECLGLRWNAVAEDCKSLRVKWVVDTRNNNVPLKESIHVPKSKAAARVIFLAPELSELLQIMKKDADSDWLFPHADDPERPMKYSFALKNLWQALQIRHGVLTPEGKPYGFHTLRHNYGSVLVRAGHIGQLSKLMGHEKAAFSIDRYSHFIQDGGDEMRQIILSVVQAYTRPQSGSEN